MEQPAIKQSNQPPNFWNVEYVNQAEKVIAETLARMEADGKQAGTINGVRRRLLVIARGTNVFDPEAVKAFISGLTYKSLQRPDLVGKPVGLGYKANLADIYQMFAKYNDIKFENPNYKYQAPIPMIPRTADVEAIINNASKEFAVIFNVMKETGADGQEMHNVPMNQLNAAGTQAVISIVGVKEHDNNAYTLSEQTTLMLKEYLKTRHDRGALRANVQLQRDPETYPFPTSKQMGQAWRNARSKAARKLCKPSLNDIDLKSLRNYAGAIFYTTMGKDPIATKFFMRHKKLEQTMHYLKAVTTFTAESKKIGKCATTAEEVMELILQGFKEETVFGAGTPDEKHILSKCIF